MNNYFIKQNGYIIGTAKGKYKAVKQLEKILDLNGKDINEKWSNHQVTKDIICKSNGNVYSIEEGR